MSHYAYSGVTCKEDAQRGYSGIYAGHIKSTCVSAAAQCPASPPVQLWRPVDKPARPAAAMELLSLLSSLLLSYLLICLLLSLFIDSDLTTALYSKLGGIIANRLEGQVRQTATSSW